MAKKSSGGTVVLGTDDVATVSSSPPPPTSGTPTHDRDDGDRRQRRRSAVAGSGDGGRRRARRRRPSRSSGADRATIGRATVALASTRGVSTGRGAAAPGAADDRWAGCVRRPRSVRRRAGGRACRRRRTGRRQGAGSAWVPSPARRCTSRSCSPNSSIDDGRSAGDLASTSCEHAVQSGRQAGSVDPRRRRGEDAAHRRRQVRARRTASCRRSTGTA